ncbi:MAG: DUF2155 domain-containing protein [Alphaproteobacteria bacterium]|nr:DUF2155 domain-containing protein [Alphaproteobacteria bacterium]
MPNAIRGVRLATLAALWVALSGATFLDRDVAVLQALDKITAQVSEMTVKVGETAQFGRLLIKVDACRVRPPEEPPEAAVFLEITDLGRRDTGASQAFRGWMFASSPSLSAMDHPVYDIWLAGCEKAG